MKKIASILIIACIFITSCSKDDTSDKEVNSNKFNYKGQDYITDISTFLDADGSTYVFFENSDLNKVEGTNFRFTNRNFDQLTGTYTFHPDIFDPTYNPASNFSFAALTLTNGLPLTATDGTISIIRNNGNNITVNYNLTTPNGLVEGHYSGNSISR